MKIVLDDEHWVCHLSAKGMLELIKLGAKGIRQYPLAEWMADGRKDLPFNVDVGEGYQKSRHMNALCKDGRVYAFDENVEYRTDPILVGVIERLGAEASASPSLLVVREIPDDIKPQMEHWEARECVGEKHRRWCWVKQSEQATWPKVTQEK